MRPRRRNLWGFSPRCWTPHFTPREATCWLGLPAPPLNAFRLGEEKTFSGYLQACPWSAGGEGKDKAVLAPGKSTMPEPLARQRMHSTTADAEISICQNVSACKTIPLPGDTSRRSVAAPTLLQECSIKQRRQQRSEQILPVPLSAACYCSAPAFRAQWKLSVPTGGCNKSHEFDGG